MSLKYHFGFQKMTELGCMIRTNGKHLLLHIDVVLRVHLEIYNCVNLRTECAPAKEYEPLTPN